MPSRRLDRLDEVESLKMALARTMRLRKTCRIVTIFRGSPMQLQRI